MYAPQKLYINQAIRRIGVADDNSEIERLQCTVRAREKEEEKNRH
jgi:hypothetical protein